jgi:hypothetical protein
MCIRPEQITDIVNGLSKTSGTRRALPRRHGQEGEIELMVSWTVARGRRRGQFQNVDIPLALPTASPLSPVSSFPSTATLQLDLLLHTSTRTVRNRSHEVDDRSPLGHPFAAAGICKNATNSKEKRRSITTQSELIR